MPTNVLNALERIEKSLEQRLPFFQLTSWGKEHVFVRWAKGSGTLRADSHGITFQAQLYDEQGREDGKLLISSETTVNDPVKLILRPPNPQVSIDDKQPVERIPTESFGKALFTFADASTLTALGIGTSNVILLEKDDKAITMEVLAMVITGGTGRFEGARGLCTANRSVFDPPKGSLLDNAGKEVKQTQLYTFRVILGGDIKTDPPPGDIASHNTPVRNSTIHFREIGQGDPILFLHGNPASSYLWRKVMPLLQAQGRCLAPDLIGMGKSGKPSIDYTFADHASYLEEWIRILNLDRIVLALHDWGTALGFHFAMRYPDKVRGIVFMEPLMRPYDSLEEFPAPGDQFAPIRNLFAAFREGEEGGPGWKKVVDQNEFLGGLVMKQLGPVLTEAEKKEYLAPFLRPEDRKPIWRFAKDLPIGGEPSEVTSTVQQYSQRLQASDIPKLLLYADAPLILAPSQLEWAVRNLSNLTTRKLGGAGGHFLPETNASEIAWSIASWLGDLK